MKTGRNDPCPCGSGKKYKHCCGVPAAATPAPLRPPPAKSAAPSGELALLATLMNQGRFAEAEARSRALLAREPGLGIAWKMLGVARAMLGQDAREALATACRLLPTDPEAHYYRGSALAAAADPAGAEQAFRQAIALRPGFAEAHNELAHALLARGQTDEAIATLRAILGRHPDFVPALGTLATAERLAGRLEAAAAGFRRALALAPGLADAHYNLGATLWDLGQQAEALTCYQTALRYRADYVPALTALAGALATVGRPQEAAACYQRAAELEPGERRHVSALGAALMQAERHGDAAAAFRRAVALDRSDAAALVNLSHALRCAGDLRGAVDNCQAALALQPDLADGWLNLGNALLDLGELPEAEASYRRALELRPADTLSGTALAMLLRRNGRTAEAEVLTEAVLAAAPRTVAALAAMADLKADRGQFGEAERLLREAIEVDPSVPEAWIGIPRFRRMTAADEGWLEGARGLLARGLPVGHEINLRHALGKFHDDRGETELAFESHRRANALRGRYGHPHDRELLRRRVDDILQTFNADWFERTRPDGDPSRRPVFILGMPRSGTTLAEQILAAHPAVQGGGELVYWNIARAAFDPSQARSRELPTIIRGLAAEYLERLAALSADALRVTDKLPGNFMNLGLIHAALPGARVIHLQRDPVDTCLSIFFQGFMTAHSYATDLDDLADYYRQYRRLMAHWRELLPAGTLLEVPYESLVGDPETWSRAMVEHAGLPWDSRCLDFRGVDRPVLTASNWQVRQPIYTSAVGRSARYAHHLGPLLALRDG